MSLYEKIFNVMNETEGLEKNLQVGTGKSSYKAVGESEVLNMMKPLFKKHRLVIFPVDGDITEHNSTFEAEYNGATTIKTRNVTQLKVKFKIVDVDTGESEYLTSFGNGADSQDKGSGKAFTYAFKSVLIKTFMLFSGEDTDNEHSDDIGNHVTNNKTSNEQKELISEGQAKRLFALANGNKEIVEKVIKNHGYNKTIHIKKLEYQEISQEISNEIENLRNQNKGASK